jgi:hypothetical protein
MVALVLFSAREEIQCSIFNRDRLGVTG